MHEGQCAAMPLGGQDADLGGEDLDPVQNGVQNGGMAKCPW